MRADEILQAVEGAGGAVLLAGDKVRCRLPETATDLIDLVREHRDGVLNVLRQRSKAVSGWVRTACVRCDRGRTNPSTLFREYRSWAKESALGYDAFLHALAAEKYVTDMDGMLMGLMLVPDFLAAVEYESGKSPRRLQ